MDDWRGAARRIFESSPPARRYSEEDYELLPGETGSPRPQDSHRRRTTSRHVLLLCQKTCTLRRVLLGLAAIPVLLALGILWSGIPPDYADIREYERTLPQHNLSLPYPEGQDGLYLRFPDHLWGHGLNNILQETWVPMSFPRCYLLKALPAY